MKFIKKIEVSSKLQLKSDEGFFGPGVCRLLEYIDEYGSVQKACEEMKISYSKARKIILRLEKQVDTSLVERKAGGNQGGSAHLTKEGKELMKQYKRMNTQLQKVTNALFLQYFGGYLNERNENHRCDWTCFMP